MSTIHEHRPWTEQVVKEYLTATSQQKSDPEKFYKTHLDIDRIYAEFLADRQDTYVTQEDIRDELVSGPVDADIQTYILKGETGSGKSQLCQWLDYELQGIGEVSSDTVADRIPLHIKASETSLETIIETLATPLGVDPEISQVSDLDPSKVADAIVTNLSANPGQKLKEANVDQIIEEGGLSSILESNIERYQRGLESSDETEFDPNLISKEDYRDISLTLGTGSVFHKNARILRQALRDEIHRHFSHVIGVTDFQGQLLQYTEQYIEEMEKRPVIICEDVTTFSVLKEQLLDQIIQVESASFDIVLGYTTGFEQDDLQDALGDRESQDALTYLKDRSEGYLSLTENGVALFLDDGLAIYLVRKYLNVIKSESGGGVDPDVESAFDGLYPFNEATIRIAYGNLIEGGSTRQTPRVLLQKVVRRCLLADEAPYETLDRNTNVADVVSPANPVRYSGEIERLTTWYGFRKFSDPSEGQNPILVSTGVLEEFGFDADVGDDVFEDEESGREYVVFEPNAQIDLLMHGGTPRPAVIGGESTGGDTGDSPSGLLDETVTETGGTGDRPGEETEELVGDQPVEPPEPETDPKIPTRIKEFTDWIKTGSEYDSSNVLRSGAETVLETWYDNNSTRLANPNASTTGTNGIYFTHGSTVPVSIQGPDERDDLSVMLEFGIENYHLYFDILMIGMHEGDGLPEDVDHARLRSWATDSVVGLRHDIRETVEACLPNDLTIEHCIVLAKFLLVNAEFGETKLSRELLFDRRTPADDRDYDEPVRSALNKSHPFVEQLNRLKERRGEIEGLADGFFLLKKNLVDHGRLVDVHQDVAGDLEGYLELAQQINTAELEYEKWYRVGSNRGNARTHATTFLDAISDYAVQLEMLTDGDLEGYFNDPMGAVERWHDPGQSKADLKAAFESLQSALGTFGVTKAESWEKAYETLTATENTLRIKEFSTVLEELNSSDASTPFDRLSLLHDFQLSRGRHGAWDVYKAFDEMIRVLGDQEIEGTDDLHEQVRDLDAVREYERQRDAVIRATEEY